MKYRTIGKAAVALLLAAALLFSAVGCGPQAQTVPEASSSSAAAPEPADSPEEEDLPVGVIAETADTITYDDMLAGEVTIQKRPQRGGHAQCRDGAVVHGGRHRCGAH